MLYFKAFEKYLRDKIDLCESKLELIRSVTVEMEIQNLMRTTLKKPCYTIPPYSYERPAICEGFEEKTK
jgi:hypothetical protein